MTAATDADRRRLGLCAECAHAKRVRNTRGSEFLLCELSKTDPRFPKYPRVPVTECDGFAPVGREDPASDG